MATSDGFTIKLNPNWHDQMAAVITSKLDIVGAAMVKDAQAIAPVLTGELRDSIGYEVNGLSLTLKATSNHAVYPELGTSTQEAQPYLSPTVMRKRNLG